MAQLSTISNSDTLYKKKKNLPLIYRFNLYIPICYSTKEQLRISSSFVQNISMTVF